ncbi:transposase [Xenorhabdus beddingii]|uniref:Transposase n=1 Tax=Xenorhabdus beddingii TaxID=40578 RepID=A0A1Y2SS49_9GAMM|nr:transposase [Xenorhabdus beddingii]
MKACGGKDLCIPEPTGLWTVCLSRVGKNTLRDRGPRENVGTTGFGCRRDEKQERAYYIVYARREQADLKTLVQVAGCRWEIGSGFEETKGECGLDHDEVRQWHSWYRHITLSLLAHAVLASCEYRRKKHRRGW